MSLQPGSAASAPNTELRGLRLVPETGGQEREEAEPGTGTHTGGEDEMTPGC